jgi:ribose transport system ATP-binding protein
MRSIVAVPLRIKGDVIGVLEVLDTAVDHFQPADLTLIESLSATASVAIENARLYKAAQELHRQAQHDAEAKATLLREVNHRVNNNLTGILGMLYTARNQAVVGDQATYQSVMDDLIRRVRGLATVHSMLSNSEWAPLPLSELALQVLSSSLQVLPHDKRVTFDVTPAPVRVMPDRAHNLGLLISKLTANVVKYALPERDTAHIDVRIALNDDVIRLEFRDNGPGYPQDLLRSDVEFDLVRSIVCRYLRGELSLYNNDGAVAVMRFKAEEGEI